MLDAFEESDHWQFALACAVQFLQETAHAFDFHKSLSGHAAYVGITPEMMIGHIDAFLREVEWVPGGTATVLRELREVFIATIAPAYEMGKSTAHNLWQKAISAQEREDMAYTHPEEVMAYAWRYLPPGYSPCEANWFVEGFCYQWAHEWFEEQADKIRSEDTIQNQP